MFEFGTRSSLSDVYNREKLPFDSIIIRLSGEITIKSEGVRRYWERKLTNYIKRVVGDSGVVRRVRGRFYVSIDGNAGTFIGILNRLKKIFGISSLSPAISCESEIEDIKKCAEKVVDFYLNNLIRKAESFAIICKKSLSPIFGTTEVRVDVGAHIKEKFNLKVDLSNPDIPLNVEVRENETFVFVDTIKCFGGLPYGVQDKLISLVSGGPDSTLATWFVMRRGSPVTCLYFDFGVEELREDARKRVITVCKHLFKEWTPDGKGRLYILPFTEVLRVMNNVVDEKKYMYVLLKKMMYHYASIIAEKEEAVGLVTGEIIGEHASQTAWNLNVISHDCGYQVLRPVSCLDKSDVFKILKSIDETLYTLSSKSVEPCRAIAKAKPTTVADVDKIAEYKEKVLSILHEKKIDILDKAFIIEF